VNSSNQVEERIVQLGLRNDKSIEIISGIEDGETIAVSNLARLKTGSDITPNILAE
jgi:multidrug efflux pump subunit AcrA (membrane-fusion protein)